MRNCVTVLVLHIALLAHPTLGQSFEWPSQAKPMPDAFSALSSIAAHAAPTGPSTSAISQALGLSAYTLGAGDGSLDMIPADRFRQMMTGALGHFAVGKTIAFEGSTITLPIRASLPNGWISTEEVDLKAFMRLELGRRVKNQLGRTQFEFDVLVWELHGRSQLLSEKLGKEVYITFSLTPPPQKQPRSICVANQEGADFPATIIYSACYAVYANKEKLIEGQMGLAICTPVVSIPPRNVLVAFEKPFEDRKMGIAFGRGCCWGMRTITPKEFLAGVNHAREIRGWAPRKGPYGNLFGK